MFGYYSHVHFIFKGRKQRSGEHFESRKPPKHATNTTKTYYKIKECVHITTNIDNSNG